MKLQNIENPNLIADLAYGWSLYDKKRTISKKTDKIKRKDIR